jgi:hypothetical protein
VGAVEESPLLEAVTRERLVKTQQTENTVCCRDLLSAEISNGAIIKCSHKLCVKVVNKYNLQFKTMSVVTHTGDSTIAGISMICVTDIFVVMNEKIDVFWNVSLCSLIERFL